MTGTVPAVRPARPFFSSGPCAKRPGWTLEALNGAVLGRSHRSKPGKAKLNEWMEVYLSDYFGSYGDQLPPPGLYDRILRDVEAPLITAALTATRGNQIKAAELLGLNRNTLRKKVREQKIRVVRSPV